MRIRHKPQRATQTRGFVLLAYGASDFRRLGYLERFRILIPGEDGRLLFSCRKARE